VNAETGSSGPTVLVVAAGRRTTLVRAFVEATRTRGGRTIAGDVDPLAPALYLADEAVRLPRTTDPGYIRAVLDVVERHHVGLLVPTIDTDLPSLAHNVEMLRTAGCRLALSSASFIRITGDKVRTTDTFESLGIDVPIRWLPPIEDIDGLPERVVVKPRNGSASVGVHEVGRDQLAGIIGLVTDPIVQEVLDGPEITIDALLDFDGRPLHYVPRRRIKTVGGESIEGVTLEHDPSFEAWIVKVLERAARLGAAGPLTLQAFLTPRGPVLTEINPRFGGGYPLGLAAGATYPDWLLDLVDGRTVEPRLGVYEPGLYMTRYHVEHFTRQPKW
jgi:carbamoyl-phosphate synthase large subunit